MNKTNRIDLWKNVKWSNIHASEFQKRIKQAEKIFKVMTTDFKINDRHQIVYARNLENTNKDMLSY